MWHFFVAICFHIWNHSFRVWDRTRFREPPKAVPRRSAPLARPRQGRGRHHRRAVAASQAFHRAGQGSGKVEGTLEV
ncbi:hypothetical protein WCP94_003777 [Bilophila wadsworthia]